MTKAEIQAQAQAIIAKMSKSSQAVAKRATEAPEYRSVTAEGDYLFKIEEYRYRTSHQNWDGTPKADEKIKVRLDAEGNKLPMYQDCFDELVLKLRVVPQGEDDEDKGKTHFARVRMSEFKKFGDVPEDERDNYELINGYACVQNEDGEWVRIALENPAKLGAVHNQISNAMECTGMNVVEAVITAYTAGTPFGLKLEQKPYQGKMYLNEKNYFPASALIRTAQNAELDGDFS